jgi:predicted transcriptional regulator
MVILAVRELKNNDWSLERAQKPTRHWGPIKDEDRTRYAGEREDGIIYRTHQDIDDEKSALKSNIDAAFKC